ncbi:phage tail tape measure protein [Moraxella haemolytica]|uniref:phage tail tape measure protein n=1 Tax=Moraxella haemolytica TaxID=2904119 RepID=UPI002542C1BE|nr:phage tail tape measure protein [Moraxella sp. ZY171148]WII94695.1 phage tail tape measure protein [Moraxella sp. ZY171148]
MSVLFLNINFKGNDQLSSAVKKINTSAKKLTSQLNDTQKKLTQLSKFQLKNDTFIKLKADFEQNSQALDNHRKKVAALQQQLSKGGGKQLAQELKKAESETKKLENAVSQGKSKLLAYRQELNQAGYQGKSFADVQKIMKRNVNQVSLALENQISKQKRLEKAEQRYDKAKNLSNGLKNASATTFGWAAKTGIALAIPTKLAIDVEQSMADVAKVVDGLKIDGKVTQEYHQFEAQMTQMSNRLGKRFSDVAAIVAGGAQGGIAKNELMQFAESASKISVAWDMAAGDVGQSLAELRSTLTLSQNDVEHLADQINYLGNNSTNNAAHILEVVQRVGSVGAAAGVSGELIAAMGASLSGIDPSSASTGLKNIIKSLAKGDSATKSQKKAWLALGTTAEKMAVDMLKDPEKAIKKYLEMLGRLPKEQRLAYAGMISGDEALPVLAQMMNNPTKFQSYASDLKDNNKVGGSVDTEYDSAVSTTAFRIEQAKVKMQNFGKDFGKHLLPILADLADRVSTVMDKISELASTHPNIFEGLAKAAAVAVALLGALALLAGTASLVLMPFFSLNLFLANLSGGAVTLGTIFAKFASILKPLSGVLGFAKTAIFGVGKAFLTLGRLMLTNPIIAIMAAIAVAAYLIYANWDKVVGAVAGAVNVFKSIVSTIDDIFTQNPILNFIIPIIGIPRMIIANWDSISTFFSTLWGDIQTTAKSAWNGLVDIFRNNAILDAFKSAFHTAMDFLSGLVESMRNIGSNIIDGLIAGIKAGFERLKGLWQKVNSYMPNFSRKSMDIHSPSRVMRTIGGHIMDGMTVGIERRFATLKKTYGTVMDYLGSPNTANPAIKMVQTVGKSLGSDNATGDLVRMVAPKLSANPLVGMALDHLPKLMSRNNAQMPKPAHVTPIKSANAVTMGAGTSSAGVSHTSTSNITINIQATSGMDTHALARQVRDELERYEQAKAAKHRARLTD